VLHIPIPIRVFKTARFSRAAKKARISDAELCAAISQVELGQADDLGGGVFKQRLDTNRHRSIILARAGSFWLYEYLFAKKDRANISQSDLINYRVLAKAYSGLTSGQFTRLLEDGDIEEICNDQAFGV
jgi:hypothetical protein